MALVLLGSSGLPGDGTSMAKHVEFDTCHELFLWLVFFVFYWGHFLLIY
jgi:hypothetical protein